MKFPLLFAISLFAAIPACLDAAEGNVSFELSQLRSGETTVYRFTQDAEYPPFAFGADWLHLEVAAVGLTRDARGREIQTLIFRGPQTAWGDNGVAGTSEVFAAADRGIVGWADKSDQGAIQTEWIRDMHGFWMRPSHLPIYIAMASGHTFRDGDAWQVPNDDAPAIAIQIKDAGEARFRGQIVIPALEFDHDWSIVEEHYRYEISGSWDGESAFPQDIEVRVFGPASDSEAGPPTTPLGSARYVLQEHVPGAQEVLIPFVGREEARAPETREWNHFPPTGDLSHWVAHSLDEAFSCAEENDEVAQFTKQNSGYYLPRIEYRRPAQLAPENSYEWTFTLSAPHGALEARVRWKPLPAPLDSCEVEVRPMSGSFPPTQVLPQQLVPLEDILGNSALFAAGFELTGFAYEAWTGLPYYHWDGKPNSWAMTWSATWDDPDSFAGLTTNAGAATGSVYLISH